MVASETEDFPQRLYGNGFLKCTVPRASFRIFSATLYTRVRRVFFSDKSSSASLSEFVESSWINLVEKIRRKCPFLSTAQFSAGSQQYR